MKKLIVLLFCITYLFITPVFALDFHNANQVSLAWDAVTTDIDGDSITGVNYRIYLANADTDPNKANPVIVEDNIVENTKTISLNTKGRYYVGVQAFLGDQESVINWGDEVENMGDNSLFGLRWAVPPHPAKNLKR